MLTKTTGRRINACTGESRAEQMTGLQEETDFDKDKGRRVFPLKRNLRCRGRTVPVVGSTLGLE
jgi:hypothetical protein